MRSEATSEVERIGNTLKTLNGIFKDMQNDKISMTMSDLNAKVSRQAMEIRSLKQKNEEIKSLKEDLLSQRIKTTLEKREVDRLKEVVETLKQDIESKEDQIKELTEEEYQRRVEVEKLKSKLEDDDSSEEEEDGAQEGENAGVTGGVGLKSTMYMARITESGEIVWKQPMVDIDNVAEEFDRAKATHRLLCHNYRLMLPNLGPGVRPPRNLFWVRRCMRAIFHAKMMDDLCLCSREEKRTRFPELVYSWFDPDEEFVKSIDDEETRTSVQDRSNQDRWGLYYGVKHLSVDDAEAWLFFQFLDENKGEDYLSFFIFAFEVAEGLCGELLKKQFSICQHGLSGHCQSHAKLTSAINRYNMLLSTGVEDTPEGDEYGCGGSDVIWLPYHVASKAVCVLFASSVEKVVKEAEEMTSKLAIDPTDRLTTEDIDRYCYAPVQPEDLESNVAAFSDESSLDSLGLEKKAPQAPLEEWMKPKCVNLFLWLRQVMGLYEKEAAHRRAAVRLMFETASTGALTTGVPHKGDGHGVVGMMNNDGEEKHIDLPQFLAIARTVFPLVSTIEAASLFRDSYNVMFPPSKHHKPPPPGITFSSFLQAAEDRQFFTMSMQLPMFLSAEQRNTLTPEVAVKMTSLLHMHVAQLGPTLEKIKGTLTDRAKRKIIALQAEVDSGLFDKFSTTNGGTKIMRPLAAYRRLLAHLLSLRSSIHEKGDGFAVLVGEGGENKNNGKPTTAAQLDAPSDETSGVEKLHEDKVGVEDTSNEVGSRAAAASEGGGLRSSSIFDGDDDDDDSMVVAAGKDLIKVLDPRKVYCQSSTELSYLREIIMNFIPSPQIKALKLITENTACIRLQRTWRKKLERELGPPPSLRQLMRVGYMRGDGDVRYRRVNRSVAWTQGIVSELFGNYLHVLHDCSQGCTEHPTFMSVVYRFFINRWGCVSLAERDMHDLYLNVRNMSQRVPRCRLFAAFTGCLVRGSADERALCKDFGSDWNSLRFYLRAVLLVHAVHEKVTITQAKKLNNAYNPSRFFLLFPTSTKDARGRMKWEVPCLVLTQCTKLLFQSVHDNWGSAESLQEYKHLHHKIEDMASGNSRLVDVDEWTWLAMAHWSSIKSKRRTMIFRSQAEGEVPGPSAGDELKKLRSAFLSVHGFQLHSKDVILSSKGGKEGNLSPGPDDGKPPTSNRSKSTTDGDILRRSVTGMLTESKLFLETLQMSKNDNMLPHEAVCKSIHRHAMSDINITLPLEKLPSPDGNQLAMQLLISWNSFKRPLKFLLEEVQISPDNVAEADTKEIKGLLKELGDFEALADKLDTLIGYTAEIDGGEAEQGADAIGGSAGLRPNTASQDNRVSEVLDSALEAWDLFRHLLALIKHIHAKHAIDAEAECHGSAQDPLLTLHHPLKDNWEVGRRPSFA